MDGSMVPVVEPSPDAEDHRKGKVLSWKEVRLNLVHPQGQCDPGVRRAILPAGLKKAGGNGGVVRRKPGSARQVTCMRVGDGAPWIANQVDLQFGTQGSYLVDFFHVCEYLGEAAPVCAADHPQAWLDVQKERLKANQVGGGPGRLGAVRQGGSGRRPGDRL